jgi:hypothetical protein
MIIFLLVGYNDLTQVLKFKQCLSKILCKIHVYGWGVRTFDQHLTFYGGYNK